MIDENSIPDLAAELLSEVLPSAGQPDWLFVETVDAPCERCGSTFKWRDFHGVVHCEGCEPFSDAIVALKQQRNRRIGR